MADDPVATVTWMIRGQWVSLALRAAVRLGVLDHLDAPATADQLAPLCGARARDLDRLLRVLVDLDLLIVAQDGYQRTALGETLTSQHPSQLRTLAVMQTIAPNLAAWSHLDDALSSGAAVFEAINGTDYWDYLSAHPEEQEDFNAAMARRSVTQVEALRAAGPVAGTVVDVGGGRGAMLAGLLEADADLRGVLADRPDVAAEGARALVAFGDRVTAVPTDFFVEVPTGGDVYLISNVLHDWDDEPAIAILRTVARAMVPGARLWVVEQVLDAPGRSAAQTRDLHLLDLHMLVMFGARERTTAEYDALCGAAGFEPVRVLAGDGVWNVLETRLRPAEG